MNKLQKSNFNYSEYGIINKNELEFFHDAEETIISQGKIIIQATLEIGKKLSEVQMKLANAKNGIFMAWYEHLGLSKNFVYRKINRWKFFEKYQISEIRNASKRTIEFVKQNEDRLDEEVIEQIFEKPDKASEKIRELKRKIEVRANINEYVSFDLQIKLIEDKIDKCFDKIERLEAVKKELVKRKGQQKEKLETSSEYDDLTAEDLEYL